MRHGLRAKHHHPVVQGRNVNVARGIFVVDVVGIICCARCTCSTSGGGCGCSYGHGQRAVESQATAVLRLPVLLSAKGAFCENENSSREKGVFT